MEGFASLQYLMRCITVILHSGCGKKHDDL
jgi:hypothetical protein